MSLKYQYRATRGGKKDLIRDARPGDTVYVINEHSDRGMSYSVRVVTNERSWPSGVLMVECPATGATWSITQLLASEREVYGQQPAGLPNRAARVRHADYNQDAELARQEVSDRLVDSKAVDLAQHYKRLARR
ncbi:hypothetical protein OG259_07660 [Streptomyces sp. NBC_00250]|uniref:hypothetical protein n=1 Tax=Streptomyces sp. NBC_00250 TaxID=2903641 RepID=UPI002E2AC73A|nr:hypothetical protein [Streptomyces sp. NBC_00250]